MLEVSPTMSFLSLPAGASLAQGGTGSPTLTLNAAAGSAQIALVGATVLSYVPSGGKDLLWLSPVATCADGKPIRGGVPLCGPWFGPHPFVASAPAHGLMRTRLWDLVRVETLADGRLRAEFHTDFPAQKELGWLHHAAATFTVTVGATLSLELSIRNTGGSSFVLTNALHTYFSVGDVRQARVEGLSEREYIDFNPGAGARRHAGAGPVSLTGEAAHFYLNSAPVRLVDPVLGRAISLRGWGSSTTVLWNPWEKTGLGLGDVGAEWPRFLCVENANVPDSAVLLAPSTSQHLGVEIACAAL
jgi:glucose-6-phosphate 1-epimerase